MAMRPTKTREMRSVRFGSTQIAFELTRSDAPQLKISVNPDLSVHVVAPTGRTGEEVDRRVIRRAAWIIRQQNYFQQFRPEQPERRYVSGESHYYLGRQYRLKVHQSADMKAVKLIGRFLNVHTPDKNDREAVQKQVEDWYRIRAKEIFNAHVRQCHERMKRYGVTMPPMTIKKMAKRWGSLTPSGAMILNLDLIKAPLQCIDYVIIHELCHTKERHHGLKFEALLTKSLPDWKRIKDRLERVEPGKVANLKSC